MPGLQRSGVTACVSGCLSASLVAGLALSSAACVENNADSPLVILRNLAPGIGCALDPSSSAFRSSGFIDTDASRGYLFTPAVRNDLQLAEGETPTIKTIFVEGARVELEFYDSTLFDASELSQLESAGLTRFETPTSGAIDPDGGLASFAFEIVPPGVVAAIAEKLPAPTMLDPAPSQAINVSVRLFGRRGGGEVESNIFHYPVEVCADCAVRFVGLCGELDQSFQASTGGACQTLQDGVLDCCDNGLGGYVCPAAPPQN